MCARIRMGCKRHSRERGIMDSMLRPVQILVVAALTAALACGGSPAAPGNGSDPPPIVVALGDSLTEGPGISQSQAYPARLEQRLRSEGYPHEVLNRGVSGDTSADALLRLDAALVPNTRVLIVALGANDGLRGVPVAEVRTNIAAIIEEAQRRELRVLLCGMEAPPLRSVQYSLEFHDIFPDLAQRYGVPLMPFLLADVLGDPALNLLDAFHPNAAGHRRIADNMWPYLEPLLR